MTTLEQVQDNVASMAPFIPLSTTEQDTLARALDVFKAQKLAPCTACKYCMPCPAGVNIPGMLHAWNEYRLCGDRLATLKEEYEDAPAATRAEHCIKCRCLPAQMSPAHRHPFHDEHHLRYAVIFGFTGDFSNLFEKRLRRKPLIQ